mmetsp:Transcript_20430/g.62196  ORF Transcript_20430/g.62196 Transcript_20430/m.62196 type:complete len:339 (-) Transcript_20430:2168-3184(-)
MNYMETGMMMMSGVGLTSQDLFEAAVAVRVFQNKFKLALERRSNRFNARAQALRPFLITWCKEKPWQKGNVVDITESTVIECAEDVKNAVRSDVEPLAKTWLRSVPGWKKPGGKKDKREAQAEAIAQAPGAINGRRSRKDAANADAIDAQKRPPKKRKQACPKEKKEDEAEVGASAREEDVLAASAPKPAAKPRAPQGEQRIKATQAAPKQQRNASTQAALGSRGQLVGRLRERVDPMGGGADDSKMPAEEEGQDEPSHQAEILRLKDELQRSEEARRHLEDRLQELSMELSRVKSSASPKRRATRRVSQISAGRNPNGMIMDLDAAVWGGDEEALKS